MSHGLRDKNLKTFLYQLSNYKSKIYTKIHYEEGDLSRPNSKILNSTFFLSNFLDNLNTTVFCKDFNTNIIKIFYLKFFFYKFSSLKFNLTSEKDIWNFDTNKFTKQYIIDLFDKPNIIFSYFVYSVDKNVRKFSRGKSGKYTFVWKYIAPYKRIFLSMRLFVKSLKFKNEKKFYKNFLNSLFFLDNNFYRSFLWKFKNYTHNFVFKNFKKSSMLSLKTINKKK